MMGQEIAVSLEYFPPRTEKARTALERAHRRLSALHPEYCSVTFGAGGSTQQGTLETVTWLLEQGVEAAPHLSCVGVSTEDVADLVDRYLQLGVQRIVALRGDLPSGMVDRGDFQHAIDLVRYLRAHYSDRLVIEVAAYPEFHPQAPTADLDLDYFVAKVDAGANGAITQYFFNLDAYLRFVDDVRARGCDAPITPGIMPITNYERLIAFSDRCGAEVPRWLRWRLEQWRDQPESLRAFGRDVVARLCEQLITAGAPGLHFYTLNLATPTLAIAEALGWPLTTNA